MPGTFPMLPSSGHKSREISSLVMPARRGQCRSDLFPLSWVVLFRVQIPGFLPDQSRPPGEGNAFQQSFRVSQPFPSGHKSCGASPGPSRPSGEGNAFQQSFRVGQLFPSGHKSCGASPGPSRPPGEDNAAPIFFRLVGLFSSGCKSRGSFQTSHARPARADSARHWAPMAAVNECPERGNLFPGRPYIHYTMPKERWEPEQQPEKIGGAFFKAPLLSLFYSSPQWSQQPQSSSPQPHSHSAAMRSNSSSGRR